MCPPEPIMCPPEPIMCPPEPIMCPPEPTRRSEVRNKICALLYPLYGQCSLDVIVQKHLTFTFRNVFLLLLQGEMTLFKHRIGDKPKKNHQQGSQKTVRGANFSNTDNRYGNYYSVVVGFFFLYPRVDARNY